MVIIEATAILLAYYCSLFDAPPIHIFEKGLGIGTIETMIGKARQGMFPAPPKNKCILFCLPKERKEEYRRCPSYFAIPRPANFCVLSKMDTIKSI